MTIVPPHGKVSRPVTEPDYKRVINESRKMLKLCHQNNGIAIAHPQVEAIDPLRFFVRSDGVIVLNPEMVSTSFKITTDLEGCLTYPFMPFIEVSRFDPCTFRYSTIDPTSHLVMATEELLTGIEARMFQHETDHLNARYIYAK